MDTDNTRDGKKWKVGDTRILIIDRLLSKGWTSYLDMDIALNEYYKSIKSKGYVAPCKDDKEYYSKIKGNESNIKVSDIPHMVDVWALVHRGVDIEGILEREKKRGGKVSENPLRDEMKQLFIEIHSIDPDDKVELDKHCLSNDTLKYIRGRHARGQKLLLFRYKEKGYSIRDDLKKYNEDEGLQSSLQIQRNISTDIFYDIDDAAKYDIIPDPDVIDRKVRALIIETLKNELIRDTTGAVWKRLEKIDGLKKSKPQGWMANTSNTYLNAIYDGQGILEGIDLGPVLHNYGSFLLDGKDYNQSQYFLNEGLDSLRKIMLSGNDKAKEEYAQILQNLAVLHITLGNYEKAEEESLESLSIFRKLAEANKSFIYGVAILLNTLAGLHINTRKLDLVEEEYEEAIRIFSKISEDEPTKFLYMLVESVTSLARYYQLVGRLDESVEAYEGAMPFLEKLSERNHDDFAPQQITAMINFASALQDMGMLDEAEHTLLETIHTLHRLNERNPNVYKEELSTVFNNLGALMLAKGDVPQAKDYLSSAEQIRKDLVKKDQYAFNGRLAATLDSIAQINQVEGDIDEAIEKWKKALTLLEIYDCEDGNDLASKLGECCFHIGSAYMVKKDTSEALQYLQRAEKIFRTLYDRDSPPKMFEDSFALTLLLIGVIYEEIEDKKADVERIFEESLDVALWYASCTQNQDLSFLAKLYFDYGCFLFEREQYEEAQKMWQQGLEYGESEMKKRPNTPYLQEILEELREGLDEIDSISEYPMTDNDEELNDDTDTIIDVCSNDNDYVNTVNHKEQHYPPEESRQKIQSIMEQICNLNPHDYDYRNKCRELYGEALDYSMSLEEDVFLADFLSAFCRFLTDGYEYQFVESFGSAALKIYEKALRNENGNFPLRLKYIKLLSDYCKSLDIIHFDKQMKAIEAAMELLVPIEINLQNDIECTYAALKGEVMLDYLVDSSSEDACEISQRILEYYRSVSKPKKSILCRFLTKAAIASSEHEDWEDAEKFIAEAETVMQDCDYDDLENLLSLGDLFMLKGRYSQFTPLKWPDNYEAYSYGKSIDAFSKAKFFLEKGTLYNPVLFKVELLNLYQAQLSLFRVYWITSKQEQLDTSQCILKLMKELCDYNEFLFSWRAIEAYLEIAESMKDIDFSLFYDNTISQEKLKNCYNKNMAMYAEMDSMAAIYRKTSPELFKNLTAQIAEAKKGLKKDYRDAVE